MASNDKSQIKKLTLSDGTKVEMDLSKANGHLLMKCRQAANGGMTTVIFMISEISTFDGQKIPAPEILNRSAKDIIQLEELWADGLGK